MTWEKGKSGNAAGRPLGSKHKLTERFLHNLHKDWKIHGMDAIERMREDSPLAYVTLVASLIPKEGHVTGKIEHEHTHGRLSETDAFLEGVLARREEDTSEESIEARPLLPH